MLDLIFSTYHKYNVDYTADLTGRNIILEWQRWAARVPPYSQGILRGHSDTFTASSRPSGMSITSVCEEELSLFIM